MAWTYQQSTGRMTAASGKLLAIGYAGVAAGKNNPAMQNVHDVGPLPQGTYTMAAPVDTVTHGPYVMWLTPSSTNEMFGRSGFGIHGDSVVHPGTASQGCIVMPRFARQAIWESGDHALRVQQ